MMTETSARPGAHAASAPVSPDPRPWPSLAATGTPLVRLGTRSRLWSSDELLHLKSLIGTMPIQEIAREIGRTTKAVRTCANARGWHVKYPPLTDKPRPPIRLRPGPPPAIGPGLADLAARVGLSVADAAYWLPRLPVKCDAAEQEARLREIAALRYVRPNRNYPVAGG